MTTVFLDCETLGLDRRAPIWEFAGIRMDDNGNEVGRCEFFIDHDPGDWLETLAGPFLGDYRRRYNKAASVHQGYAVSRIADLVDGATIAGSNPSFDMERITDLLAVFTVEPGWHYHPCDVPGLAHGWLAGRGEPIPHPRKSDALSRAAGVEPELYRRHTAMGDVEWTRDLYSVVGGGVW